ncbi:MAG: amidohydrolase family protein [Actinomycetota bacterium]
MRASSWTIAGPALQPDGTIAHRRLTIADGFIQQIDRSEPVDSTVDDGAFIAPGLIDLQINGAFGFDFGSDPCSIKHVATQLPTTGVTAFTPTVITGSAAQRLKADHALEEPLNGAVPLGIHLEGPTISPAMRGTHSVDGIMSADDLANELRALRNVAIVTYAPELDPDFRLLDLLRSRGIVPALGHSAATYAQAAAAFNRGAGMATHLFNAMAGLHHREPGLVGAVLDHTDAVGSVIADGTHLHDATLRLLWRLLGPADRMLVVSDAIAAAGLGDGRYSLGDVAVEVVDGVAANDSGALAGSAVLLLDALAALAAAVERPLSQVWAAGSQVPAEVMSDSTRGVLRVGCRADLVVVTAAGDCLRTVIGGDVVHDASGA